MSPDTDGIPLRSLASSPGFDPVRTWGPGPLLLIKPPCPKLYASATTPAADLNRSEASTSVLHNSGTMDMTEFFASEARLAPIRKSDRNDMKRQVLIGRSRTCDIRINDPTVSKVHASIFLPPGWPMVAAPDGWRLRDCHSSNGTLIPLPSGEPERAPARGPGLALYPGTRILFGAVETVFVDPDYLRDALEIAKRQWAEDDLNASRASTRSSSDTDQIKRKKP